ncbi:winged helix-turn-helix domain-containing protein [Nonomuraea sp. NPDC048916]|uniref:winged helix-turn-helix domain-containing protein n=1 Tax=Nonomuraea sp. NPDC048916 TaxID=3154232 RepID=UPI0033FFAEDD
MSGGSLFGCATNKIHRPSTGGTRISAGPWPGSPDWPGSCSECPATLSGLDCLPRRLGWSWQVPARRAVERDEQAIATRRNDVRRSAQRVAHRGADDRANGTLRKIPPTGYVALQCEVQRLPRPHHKLRAVTDRDTDTD